MASFQTVFTSNEGFDKDYLSHHIQSNKHIKGISLEPDEEIKQSLFADDATYFLNYNFYSFHNLIESLTIYGMTSGLKLNKSKCTVLRKILKKYGDSLLFECNISNTILHEIANENIFLSDVLSAWSDVTHNLETQTSSKTILWNNKDITSNNMTFFYKHWFEQNIKYVDKLYDYRIKDFYSFENICYIYGIPASNFLKDYTLIKSKPIHIKSEINTNNTPCTQTTFVENILGRKNKTNKIFYTLPIKNPTENSKTQNKWQVLFREHELNWKHIFTMPYKATIESTLRNC
ncbi:hypothetical protein DPMN_011846 [Dreissena polymorpha]|uniref:Reverse transcriptase domain-containing protein n=1 Tax=Dreissena polymorpha TaxID=45954 RepID=A0A9D4N5W8_DREPO|nr:hypothetical protein DPMN_011846 [Dreissena polymorpha]